MNERNLLLKTYYEQLYEKLRTCKDDVIVEVEKFLFAETKNGTFGNFNKEKYAAYKEACLAFVEERLEAYNPIGIQYTFDNVRRQEVYELELQLDWYDSRAEFEELLDAVRQKAEPEMSDERTKELTQELIMEYGAFPDRSIISAYKTAPALNKLPDYIVAQAIEKVIR